MKEISMILFFFMTVSSGNLRAGEPLFISPDSKISSVVSGGHWENDGAHGTYRIILWSEGFEHVSTGVVAEWLVDSPGEGIPAKLVHSEILVSPGMNSLGIPILVRTKNGYGVVLSGVSTYESEHKISCKFDLHQNMKIKVLVPCG